MDFHVSNKSEIPHKLHNVTYLIKYWKTYKFTTREISISDYISLKTQ